MPLYISYFKKIIERWNNTSRSVYSTSTDINLFEGKSSMRNVLALSEDKHFQKLKKISAVKLPITSYYEEDIVY